MLILFYFRLRMCSLRRSLAVFALRLSTLGDRTSDGFTQGSTKGSLRG